MHLLTANYDCPVCNKSYQAKSNYEGHVNAHRGYKTFRCPTCNTCFSYKSSLNVHVKHCSHAACYACTSCNAQFRTKTLINQHTLGKHSKQIFACCCGKTFKWRTSKLKHQNQLKHYFSPIIHHPTVVLSSFKDHSTVVSESKDVLVQIKQKLYEGTSSFLTYSMTNGVSFEKILVAFY